MVADAFQSMSVGQVVSRWAERTPEKVCLRWPGGELTYCELDTLTSRFARGLQGLGLSPGQRALLLLPNTVEYVVMWLGLAKAGILEVPINTQYKGTMLRYMIDNSGASVIAIDEQYIDKLRELSPLPDSLKLVIRTDGFGVGSSGPLSAQLREVEYAALFSQDGSPLGADTKPWDLVGILYTSGTTGPSKGVLITHAHAYTYANSVTELLHLTPDDVYYAPLPLFHIGGQWAVVLASFIAGATAHLVPRFSTESFWSDVNEHGVTASFLLGAMANFLYRQPPREDDSATSIDRVLVVPLLPELDDFRRRFNVRVTTCYGSTEVNVPIRAEFDIANYRSCGRAARGFQLQLIDEFDMPVPTGTVGELAVRPEVPWITMAGYHDASEATATVWRNLWLHSGDAFYQDDEGHFFFVDRVDDALRRRGENISSFEVEREINSFEAILESAVVGAPSEFSEDEVFACVVPKPGMSIDEKELYEFLVERLPRFMVPRYIQVLDEMPKTETGKIQKYVLKKMDAGSAWDATQARKASGR